MATSRDFPTMVAGLPILWEEPPSTPPLITAGFECQREFCNKLLVSNIYTPFLEFVSVEPYSKLNYICSLKVIKLTLLSKCHYSGDPI